MGDLCCIGGTHIFKDLFADDAGATGVEFSDGLSV
jgi:hypothetical protein